MVTTQNWFRITGEVLWHKHLVPRFAGKDNVKVLEIGSHEGGSAVWICEHLLNGRDCKLHCVDPFTGSMEHEPDPHLFDRFKENVGPFKDKIEIYKTKSFDFFIRWHYEHHSQPYFDLIYIDGSHVAKDVLADAVLAWPLLKTGGVLVFDDYTWEYYAEPENLPRTGIEAFHLCVKDQQRVLDAGSQVLLEKTDSNLTNQIRARAGLISSA